MATFLPLPPFAPWGQQFCSQLANFYRLGLRSLLPQNVFPQNGPVKSLRGKDHNSHFIDICFLIICFPNFFQEDLEGVSHRTKGTLKLSPLPSPHPTPAVSKRFILTVLCVSPFASKQARIEASPAYSPWAPLQTGRRGSALYASLLSCTHSIFIRYGLQVHQHVTQSPS